MRQHGSVSQYGHGGLMTGQKAYIMCCKLLKQDALQKAARNLESIVCVCVRSRVGKEGRKSSSRGTRRREQRWFPIDEKSYTKWDRLE